MAAYATLASVLSSIISKYSGVYRARRERQRMRASLSDLSDRELMNFAVSRAEIDYVASRRHRVAS
ncbi:hypothetical protein IVB12_35220 [Bradyrhizobium sp. 179]|uniref:hypothetical protein n=1 Tax=Bradyrhizobium sp. 179 TaxID=2782648 RepID=UPI001FF71C67|nr:hypothetical protein [Bradyrhizobium sp. 179]MCK1547035.1 hypothetical protein [Bradyrhizobium sp. 179]